MSKLTDARDEARRQGRTTFKVETPCRNGHFSVRFVSNLNCRECRIQYMREYRARHPEKWARYRAKNRALLAANAREYRKHAQPVLSKKSVERKRRRRHTDPAYALQHRLRSMASRAYSGRGKPLPTLELIGCTYVEFSNHIESLFKDGMSWSNRALWHIDHIKPLAAFDLTDPEQAKKAFHYSNCQPLWAVENCSKGAKFGRVNYRRTAANDPLYAEAA